MKLIVFASLLILLPGTVFAADEIQHQTYLATVDEDGVQRVQIVGGGYFFKPDHIIVKINTPVELTLRKEQGMVPHTFVIDAPGSGITIDEKLGSEAKTISFTPTVTGGFPFYCRNRLLFFKSHKDKGMKGILEVVQ